MKVEIVSFTTMGTWDLVPLLLGIPTIGCKWLYTVMFTLDGCMGHLNIHWLLRILSTSLWHYEETFFPVAKISSVQLMISLMDNLDWPYFDWIFKKTSYTW